MRRGRRKALLCDRRDLVPVLQLVVRQIQLHDVGTEGSDLSLLTSPADPTAAQHQHTGDVQAVWGGG